MWQQIGKFQLYISFSLFVYSLVMYIYNLAMQRNNQKLYRQYVKEHDERRIYIIDKIGLRLFRYAVIILFSITVIIPFFNSSLFYGILVAIGVLIVLEIVLYIYYRNKYA